MSGLPKGWAETTLKDVCRPVYKHRPTEHPDEPICYIDISAIDRQRVVETKQLLGCDAPSRARQLVRTGDTLFSTVRTYLRKTALVPQELDGATGSTGFCVLRPAVGIDSRFLFYRVLEPGFVATISARQSGSSYPAVRDADVFSQRIILPPTAEQRRIVAAIEEQFSRLDAAERIMRATKVRLGAFRDGAILASFSDDWPRCNLGEIAEIAGGVTKDQKREGDPELVEVPYLRVANVQRGFLDLNNVTTIRVPCKKAEALALKVGDVLFNEGGDRDKLGRGWVWSGEIDRCIHQNHVFRARVSSSFDPKFISWYGNYFGRTWFEEHGRQTTNLASLSLTTLKSFPVPAPSLAEQQRVVAEIERRLSFTDSLHTSIDSAARRSAALRRSILNHAFSGKLVPQDPSDEPASVLLERIASERAAQPSPRKRQRRATMNA